MLESRNTYLIIKMIKIYTKTSQELKVRVVGELGDFGLKEELQSRG